MSDSDTECEICGGATEPEPTNRGARTCVSCGVHTDESGELPRCDGKRCPDCKAAVVYGVLKDARKGIRGYYCPDCELIITPEEKEPRTTTEDNND